MLSQWSKVEGAVEGLVGVHGQVVTILNQYGYPV